MLFSLKVQEWCLVLLKCVFLSLLKNTFLVNKNASNCSCCTLKDAYFSCLTVLSSTNFVQNPKNKKTNGKFRYIGFIFVNFLVYLGYKGKNHDYTTTLPSLPSSAQIVFRLQWIIVSFGVQTKSSCISNIPSQLLTANNGFALIVQSVSYFI